MALTPKEDNLIRTITIHWVKLSISSKLRSLEKSTHVRYLFYVHKGTVVCTSETFVEPDVGLYYSELILVCSKFSAVNLARSLLLWSHCATVIQFRESPQFLAGRVSRGGESFPPRSATPGSAHGRTILLWTRPCLWHVGYRSPCRASPHYLGTFIAYRGRHAFSLSH